jgi:hypothetical protein
MNDSPAVVTRAPRSMSRAVRDIGDGFVCFPKARESDGVWARGFFGGRVVNGVTNLVGVECAPWDFGGGRGV